MDTKFSLYDSNPNCITHHVCKQGAHSAEVGALAPVFEKSDGEPKSKPNLLRCKNIISIATFYVRTLNTINQLPKLIASTVKCNISIICIQEHKYHYNEESELEYHDTNNSWAIVSVSARQNSMNAIIGGVGMLLSPYALKSLNCIERPQLRIMCVTFNGNLCPTIVSCYYSTNTRGETNITNLQQAIFPCLTHSQTQCFNYWWRHECSN